IVAPSACSLLLFTSLNNRARPCRVFRNPNRSLLSRSTAIRATEFLSPKSIPTKMCLTCIEASLLSKGLALLYSEPVPRLAFFYIVNSSRGGEFAFFKMTPLNHICFLGRSGRASERFLQSDLDSCSRNEGRVANSQTTILITTYARDAN